MLCSFWQLFLRRLVGRSVYTQCEQRRLELELELRGVAILLIFKTIGF
nr:MAG TPA: hypothetical protein [Caudoviricetes sp.]